MPIYELSPFPAEEEVVLRAPFLQILAVVADDSTYDDRRIYRVKAVLLNASRDHLSAIESKTDSDRMASDLFQALIVMEHSRICADRAERYGMHQDAVGYRAAGRESERVLQSTTS